MQGQQIAQSCAFMHSEKQEVSFYLFLKHWGVWLLIFNKYFWPMLLLRILIKNVPPITWNFCKLIPIPIFFYMHLSFCNRHTHQSFISSSSCQVLSLWPWCVIMNREIASCCRFDCTFDGALSPGSSDPHPHTFISSFTVKWFFFPITLFTWFDATSRLKIHRLASCTVAIAIRCSSPTSWLTLR